MSYRVSRRSGNISDTHPNAERVHIKLLREAGPARRASIAIALSEQVIGLSRRAMRERHPDLDDEEIALLWVASHYGADLAQRVRAHLAARRA